MLALSLLLTHTLSSQTTTLTSGKLIFTLDSTTFEYKIKIDGVEWFNSAGGSTHGFAFSSGGSTLSLGNGKLVAAGPPSTGSGADGIGTFASATLQWAAATDPNTALFSTSIRAYGGNRAGALVFQQEWLGSTSSLAGGSAFPSLQTSSTAPPLGGSEYTGSSCGFMTRHRSGFAASGGKGNGYLIFTERDSTAAGRGANHTIAMGPLTAHFVNQAHMDGESVVAYGMASSFESAPEKFSLETIMVLSSRGDDPAKLSPMSAPERVSVVSGGTNAALFEYGDAQLAYNKKNRARGDHNQETKFLGYSVTGYYFYNICDCTDKTCAGNNACKSCSTTGSPINSQSPEFLTRAATPGVCQTYEDTLLAVDAALIAQQIPYRSILLDSWWYGENVYGGANLWEDLPACVGANGSNAFPRGLKAFKETLNSLHGANETITLWGHNGKWTSNSEYRKSYDFEADNGPPQGDGVWEHLFGGATSAGLQTIKQDHMGEQMGSGAGNWKNTSVLKSWLDGMGVAASRHDVDVLYCCAPPSVHMTGVAVPAAFGVRASPDYVWAPGGRLLKLPTVQWAIGPDNAFHWNGLGLLPYKDTFFSNSSAAQQAGDGHTSSKQWPPFQSYHEMNAPTHALMSLLSMAQVTFADRVASANRTLLMMLCREDGVLLKADRPATPIDKQFQLSMFGGTKWPGQGGAPGPSPSGGHGVISLVTCGTSDSSNQQWKYDSNTGALQLAASGGGCVDISKCEKKDGSAVHLYEAEHYVCAKPGQPGTCDSKNEVWNIRNGSTTPGAVVLVSGWATKSCFAVKSGVAQIMNCDSGNDPGQEWIFSAKDAKTETVTISPAAQPKMCLTGTVAADGFDGHRFTSPNALESATSQLFGDDSNVSKSYAHAYTISSEWLRKKEERACPLDGNCPRGYGAPQGPLGEVYVTHSTIPVERSDGTKVNATWRYVVGVQVSVALNVTADDIMDTMGNGTNTEYYQFAWDDAKTFRPSTLDSFSEASPVRVTVNAGSECTTGVGRIVATTECFPFNMHVVAPVLSAPTKWVLIGEVGKFIPISNQRIESISISSSDGLTVSIVGAADEIVTMGAMNVGIATGVVYQSTTISNGSGVIRWSK